MHFVKEKKFQAMSLLREFFGRVGEGISTIVFPFVFIPDFLHLLPPALFQFYLLPIGVIYC